MAPLKIKVHGTPGKKEAAAAQLDAIIRQQYELVSADKARRPKPGDLGKRLATAKVP